MAILTCDLDRLMIVDRPKAQKLCFIETAGIDCRWFESLWQVRYQELDFPGTVL
jgi:hypothetical protein